MEKTNYQKQLDEIIAQYKNQNFNSSEKPSLLLHACCAPCSSYVIEYLASIFDITLYYYNPNIHPQKEYERRLEELKKFLSIFPEALKEKVNLVIDEYNPEDYFKTTNVKNEPILQTEPEKGERCRRCYSMRMARSWNYACTHNFNWFTTTLSISPHKDSQMINEIGLSLQNEAIANSNFKTKFLPADFKKKGGYLRSTQLSNDYELWRQDYCGCIYSIKKNEDFIK